MPKMSKTARASTPGLRSSGGFTRSPDSPIITPLGGGRWAYVFTDAGTRHLPTDSDAFLDALGGLDAERVNARLAELHGAQPTHGWDVVAGRFADAPARAGDEETGDGAAA
jgi:hypothetical protein